MIRSDFISIYPGQVQREDEDFLCASLCSVLSPFIVSTLILGKPELLSCDRHLCGSHVAKSDVPLEEKRVQVCPSTL